MQNATPHGGELGGVKGHATPHGGRVTVALFCRLFRKPSDGYARRSSGAAPLVLSTSRLLVTRGSAHESTTNISQRNRHSRGGCIACHGGFEASV